MSRRPLAGWFFTMLVAALLVNAAQAQQPGRGRPPGGTMTLSGAGMESALLGNEKVQKELELLPEQVADLTKLREATQNQMRESFGGLRDLSEDERRAKFEELRPKMEAAQKENREKVNAILLPHQQERVKEIALQLRGAAAIEDPEVAATLKISDEQKAKITSTREAQREKVGAMFREAQGAEGDRDAMREKFQALRKENDEQLLGILTGEQREQLTKMQGEKFELDMSELGRGPGGPGFGGPGGRRPGGDRPNNDENK